MTIRGLQIRYSGWQLDQADFEVLAHALYLVSAQASGKLVRFTAKRISQVLAGCGKSGREWLKDLRRLTGSTIDIQRNAGCHGGANFIFLFWFTARGIPTTRQSRAISSSAIQQWPGCSMPAGRRSRGNNTATVKNRSRQMAAWLLRQSSRPLSAESCHVAATLRLELPPPFRLPRATSETPSMNCSKTGFSSWHIDKQDKVHIDKQPPKSSGLA